MTGFLTWAEAAGGDWSPDGSRIVFTRTPSGGRSSWSWTRTASSDGSLLLVSAERADGTNDLMVIPAAGGAAVALAPAPGHDDPQAWR